MTLVETILSRRRALALTQEQVAERLGVTPQAVYKWEKDIACPDVQLLSPLARLLETDLNTLFAYDTEPDKVELSAIIERVSRLALQKDDHRRQNIGHRNVIASKSRLISQRFILYNISGKGGKLFPSDSIDPAVFSGGFHRVFIHIGAERKRGSQL